jgi:hypothetical protein
MAHRPRRTTEYAPAEMGVSIVSGPKTFGEVIGAPSEAETTAYTTFTIKKVEGGYLVRAEPATFGGPETVRERVVTTLDEAMAFINDLCGQAEAEAEAEAEEEEA